MERSEPIFSVGEFLDYVNEVFSGRSYTIEGEISEFRPHPTGVYFSLKDKEGDGILNCYMNPYAYRSLGTALEDGMLVKAYGAPRMYKPKGRFSFTTERVELSGEGSLRKAYELLKKKLENEGLFSRKREIPEFIRTVGIITSKTGAVIDDFRKNLKPLGLRLYLYDVRVEGARAHEHIAEAIRRINARIPECDVIVLIRGGGSLEDLQPFNNEIVAREIFGSRIPVIAGIGHDRDVPIASMASDYATSTPSFAAMIVNDSWKRLFDDVLRAKREIRAGSERAMRGVYGTLENAAGKCLAAMHYLRIRSREYSEMIIRTFSEALRRDAAACASAEKIIAAMNPERNLRLGYSIVSDGTGRVIKNVAQVRKGDAVIVKVSDGAFGASVEDVA